MTALDPQSPIPLYHQLADLLMDRIRTGAYPLGSRIPSEPELAQTFGIGRPTVRQATDQLVQRRCLERRRGSGTFVMKPPERVDLFALAGTMASFEKGGIEADTRLLTRARRIQVAEDAENPFAQNEAYFISRLSSVRNVPVLLEEMYLDPQVFRGLGRISLAGRSLAALADTHYNRRPISADQNFRTCRPGAERAAQLGLSPRQDVLLVKRTLHFEGAPNAIFAELYCRTDQLVFSQTLSPQTDTLEGDHDG